MSSLAGKEGPDRMACHFRSGKTLKLGQFFNYFLCYARYLQYQLLGCTMVYCKLKVVSGHIHWDTHDEMVQGQISSFCKGKKKRGFCRLTFAVFNFHSVIAIWLTLARVITRSSYDTNSSLLFDMLGWDNLSTNQKKQKAIIVYISSPQFIYKKYSPPETLTMI